MTSVTNINNLNILTFIKDIYLSLKHIDNCFNSYKENINDRLIKIEDNHNTILDKLTNIEQLLEKINFNTQNQVSLDKNIENELLKKMNILNKTSIQDKINLKIEELTFANILENNYSLLDINEKLTTQNASEIINLEVDTYTYTDNITNNSLDFSNLDLDLHLNANQIDNSIIQNTPNNVTNKIENIENLLF